MCRIVKPLIILICLAQSIYAKEVYDTVLKVKCFSDAMKVNDITYKDFPTEEISIEIKKIDWNKDSSKPPKWGSMSNIKVRANGNLYDGMLLLSNKDHVAFSLVGGVENERQKPVAYIYELTKTSMEVKKTSVSLFSQTNNRVTSDISYCKKE